MMNPDYQVGVFLFQTFFLKTPANTRFQEMLEHAHTINLKDFLPLLVCAK